MFVRVTCGPHGAEALDAAEEARWIPRRKADNTPHARSKPAPHPDAHARMHKAKRGTVIPSPV
jgi:hypothetical protein